MTLGSPASGGGGVSSPPSPGEPCHGLRKDDFYSDSRQTTMGPAVFALVNTVVGGGVLSLPYSFQLAVSEGSMPTSTWKVYRLF